MPRFEVHKDGKLVIGDGPAALLYVLDPSPTKPSRVASLAEEHPARDAAMPTAAEQSADRAVRRAHYVREQLQGWNDWCAEHRYPSLVHAAVRRAIEAGALCFASKSAGLHGVRLEGVPEHTTQGLRMAGFAHDAGLWQW